MYLPGTAASLLQQSRAFQAQLAEALKVNDCAVCGGKAVLPAVNATSQYRAYVPGETIVVGIDPCHSCRP